MKIKQFRYAADNLGYLVFSGKSGIAVDAGAVEETLGFAGQHGIRIEYVANTHSHHDHTAGNEPLLQKTGAQFINCADITSGRSIPVGTEILNVFPTPGHTRDCVTFHADDFLVTGDTLFNGTVGNCFSGDLKAFFASLKRLTAFPGNTKVYAGHDYVVESVRLAEQIEPDNMFLKTYLDRYDPALIVSSIKDELKANPYLRFNAPTVICRLEEKKLPAATEFDRFHSLMMHF